MTDRRANLTASEIMNYTQRVERSIDSLRRKNTPESELSFDDSELTAYNHTPAVADEYKIFHPSGGAVRYTPPPEDSNDGSAWFFTGATCIADIGSGATGCDSDGSTRTEELIMYLANVDQTLCEEINKRLNISGVPADTGGGLSTTKYTGSFANGTEVILAAGPFASACFSNGGNNFFYHVLLAR